MKFQIFKKRFEGSKFIGLKTILYQWKFFKTLMSKMGSYDPFEYLQHKLWLKKSWESKCQFDF